MGRYQLFLLLFPFSGRRTHPFKSPVLVLFAIVSALFTIALPLLTIISHLRALASPLKKVTTKNFRDGIESLRTDNDSLGIELTSGRNEIDPFRCTIRTPGGLI